MPINLNDIKTADDFDDGIPSQRQITTCRLDKPQPNEWFKLFNLGEGMKSFIPATITTQRDERGDHQNSERRDCRKGTSHRAGIEAGAESKIEGQG